MANEVEVRYPRPVWFVTIAGWVWVIFALVYFTDVVSPFIGFFVMAVSGLILGVAWLAHTAIWPQVLRRPACFAWFSVPVACLLVAVLSLTGWGLTLRVALSESALTEAVADATANGVPDRSPKRVGLFDVEEVDPYQGAVYFYTTTSFLNRHGVAYLPTGNSPAGRISVHHLYGPWYSFEWRF